MMRLYWSFEVEAAQKSVNFPLTSDYSVSGSDDDEDDDFDPDSDSEEGAISSVIISSLAISSGRIIIMFFEYFRPEYLGKIFFVSIRRRDPR